MMKLNFLKNMTIIFVVGLILCGIGIGISIVELYQFDYVVNDTNDNFNVSKEMLIDLPDNNAPVYYEDINNHRNDCNSFEIKEDESVPVGHIKYVVNHNGTIDNIGTDISSDKYIYDNENLFISEHKVNYLEPISYSYSQELNQSDFDSFKEILNNYKSKKIVKNADNHNFNIIIYVNPEEKGRLIKLKDYQTLITYREYL